MQQRFWICTLACSTSLLLRSVCCRCVPNALQNINALNLEPALPRLDEHDPLLSKQSAIAAAKLARSKGVLGAPLDRGQEKKNFLESLKTINSRMSRIDWKTVAANRHRALVERNVKPDADKGDDAAGRGVAKDFRFNPNADAFTPSNERSTAANHGKPTSQSWQRSLRLSDLVCSRHSKP